VQNAEARSSVGLLRDARRALRAGWYDEALSLLEGCEDWPSDLVERAAVLKAETLGRRDPGAALAYLTAVDDLFVSIDGCFAREIEGGRFQAATRDFEAAAARYGAARALAASVPHGVATMAYHDLRMRWFRRECEGSFGEAELALAHPDPSIVAGAFAYRGWLHAGRGEYRAQIADFRSALDCTATDGEPIDVATLAMTTHALARVAFEVADDEGIEAARSALETIPWTPVFDVERFGTLRALGWDAFMRGQPGSAQWAFKDARTIAPSDAWRVMSHVDRAYVARYAGNEAWAIEELAHADRLARGVQWESTFGEERQALVMLAVLCAPFDAVRAQRYAARYAQLGVENVNPAFAIASDRRTVAAARYAQGLIDMTLGRRDIAVPALREAYEIYSSAGHHYRAALAATALAESTGEERWRASCRAHASRYPDCPLSAIADAPASDEAVPAELTPFQRRLARALWKGADDAELSQRFSRSLYTIERQTAAILRAFGVQTRAELLALARREQLS